MMDRVMERRIDRKNAVWMDRWVDGQNNGLTDGWMDASFGLRKLSAVLIVKVNKFFVPVLLCRCHSLQTIDMQKLRMLVIL